jgi:hypothetical protein
MKTYPTKYVYKGTKPRTSKALSSPFKDIGPGMSDAKVEVLDGGNFCMELVASDLTEQTKRANIHVCADCGSVPNSTMFPI